MKDIYSDEMRSIEQSGLKGKLKNEKDCVLIDENRYCEIQIDFGYVISIRGINGMGFSTTEIGSFDNIYNKKDLIKSLECLVNEVKKGNNTYKLTVYISPTKIKNNIDKEVWDDEVIKDDVIDKIYRFYDVKLDRNNIEIKRK